MQNIRIGANGWKSAKGGKGYTKRESEEPPGTR